MSIKETFLSIEDAQLAILNNQPVIQVFYRYAPAVFFVSSFIKEEENEHGFPSDYIYRSTVDNPLLNSMKANEEFSLVEYLNKTQPGIRIIQTLQDLDSQPLEFVDEFSYSKETRKFNAGHFTPGTLFVSPPSHFFEKTSDLLYPDVFEVKRIVMVNLNELLIETTTPDLSTIDEFTTFITFEISRVEKILNRANNELVIEELVDYGFMEMVENMITDASECYSQHGRKNHWLISYPEYLITYLALSMNNCVYSLVDSQKLTQLASQQGFFKRVVKNETLGVYLINKKRLKSFINKNINRCLFSAKKAQKELYSQQFKVAADVYEKRSNI